MTVDPARIINSTQTRPGTSLAPSTDPRVVDNRRDAGRQFKEEELTPAMATEDEVNAKLAAQGVVTAAATVNVSLAHDRVTPLHPWSAAPTKLADPATPPAGGGMGVAWTSDGRLLAVAHGTTPFLTVYQSNGAATPVLTKIANPASLPAASGREVAWSPCGRFLSVAHFSGIGISFYERTGLTTLTKLANPATPPASSTCLGTAWSPDGQFVAVSHFTSPFFTVYKRSGTTFTKIPDPDVPAVQNSWGVAWSPDGQFLAVGLDDAGVTPVAIIYAHDDLTLTKQPVLPTGTGGVGYDVQWSPDQQILAVASSVSPNLETFQTNQDMPVLGTFQLAQVLRAGT